MAFGPPLIESYTFIPAILLIRMAILPIHVDVMSRPLLHLFGKLVYNGWAISLGGAASNIAYERRAFHVITACLFIAIYLKYGRHWVSSVCTVVVQVQWKDEVN